MRNFFYLLLFFQLIVVGLSGQCNNPIDSVCVIKLDTFYINSDSQFASYNWFTNNNASINVLPGDTMVVLDWSTSIVLNSLDSVCVEGIVDSNCSDTICVSKYIMNCVEICNNVFTQGLKIQGAPTICTYLLANTSDPLATMDCDGGGINNLTECQNGGDPEDPIDDIIIPTCSSSSVDICNYVLANAGSTLALADCDNGGANNFVECQNSLDPNDSTDDCSGSNILNITGTMRIEEYVVTTCGYASNNDCNHPDITAGNLVLPTSANVNNLVPTTGNYTGVSVMGTPTTHTPTGSTTNFHQDLFDGPLDSNGLPSVAVAGSSHWDVAGEISQNWTCSSSVAAIGMGGTTAPQSTCGGLESSNPARFETATLSGYLVIPCLGGNNVQIMSSNSYGSSYTALYYSEDNWATSVFYGEERTSIDPLTFQMPTCCSGPKILAVKLYIYDPNGGGGSRLRWNLGNGGGTVDIPSSNISETYPN